MNFVTQLQFLFYNID